MSNAIEALALGFSSGPVCLASCGPVLLPWLGAEARELRATSRLLALFLSGRLAGYLAFAVVVWAAGLALPLNTHTRTLVFGLANFGLAALLGFSAYAPRRACIRPPDTAGTQICQINAPKRSPLPVALTLGFLTGLNLCPPFITAGVRAAATANLLTALARYGRWNGELPRGGSWVTSWPPGPRRMARAAEELKPEIWWGELPASMRDILELEERRRDMMREAQQARLCAGLPRRQGMASRLLSRVLAALGRRLSTWGSRLQARHAAEGTR